MAANSPFPRPLGITAGVLGTVQAITWGILSLLGILLYTDTIEWHPDGILSNRFQMVLVSMYFVPTGAIMSEIFNTMTPGTVVVWTSIYFATSVIWLLISGFLLYDSYKSRFTSKVIIGWVAVSAVVAAIDFAGTVVFGVDYFRVQRKLYTPPYFFVPYGTEFRLAPMFMMIMCGRGFILWIMNVGLVIYLGVAASELHKKFCIGIQPGKEEDATIETGSRPDSTPARGPQ